MITPLEIQNQEFASKMRGLDPQEVKHFLYLLSEEFATLLEQNHEMSKELSVLRARVRDMEDRDKILKDTLISAQQIKREIHENAIKEAELTVREGQLKAEGLFEHAKKEVDKVARQVQEIRRVRNDMLAEVEMMVARFTHFVEAERHMAHESDKLRSFSNESSRPVPVERPRKEA
ncbi:MAG: DivIVA domain-containing protein [Acidobacteria bacterium]|nr:DivIVA domain-containing protein [Acidobacteriota bacterium]